MNRLKSLLLIGCLGAATPHIVGAQGVGSPSLSVSPYARQTPHPAVVRVTAPGKGSVSYGSGCLVAVNELHGVVITNWHVINEATGPVTVEFPDGFESAATIQKIDRDWDLAALVIWKPPVAPAPLARQAPRPGDQLTIAGYGSGKYRAASGACTQYVAPGLKFPYEMVEVSVAARQGDSGGPIFNSQGELAGVLFGAGEGRTSGSYCGRVHWFLDSVVGSRGLPAQIAPGSLIANAGAMSQSAVSLGARAVDNRAIVSMAARPAPSRPASVGQSLQSLGVNGASALASSLPYSLPTSQPQPPLEAIAPEAWEPVRPSSTLLSESLHSGSQPAGSLPAAPDALASNVPASESLASSGLNQTIADASAWRPIAIADRTQADLPIAGLADSNRTLPSGEDALPSSGALGQAPASISEPVDQAVTRWDQIKAFLAVVGVTGFLLWLARALTMAHGPPAAAKEQERNPGGRKAA